MKFNLLYLGVPFLFLEPTVPALAQGGVVQSGVVVPGNIASFTANGVIQDSGLNALILNFPTIASGDLLGNATGSPAVAGDTTLSALIDTLAGCPSDGSILVRSGAWVCLPPGVGGYYLQTPGFGSPVWAPVSIPTYTGSLSITLSGGAFSIAAPVTVANGGLGITAGINGGIPAFTATGVIASSPLLTQYAVIVGGGASGTPAPLASLGTSGQVLTSNGAGGAPSFQAPTVGGTVTQINTSGAITGGPITATGTLTARAATPGTSGVVTPDNNSAHYLSGAGTWTTPPGTTPVPLAGTTGSIGGSTLTAGACTSGTVAVPFATTAETAVVSPSADPGAGFSWGSWVSSAGTVTVRVCNLQTVSAAPSASTYLVRVMQ